MEESKKKKPPHVLVPRARELRKDDTKAEKTAWTLLKDRRLNGFKFRRQVPIEHFIVDFYCHELKLIIELDGDIHAETEQFKHDQERDERLRELGYTLVRFSNEVLFNDSDFFEEHIRSLLPSPGRFAARPLPEGEG
jgi:very-short-patch-repair endonuclease